MSLHNNANLFSHKLPYQYNYTPYCTILYSRCVKLSLLCCLTLVHLYCYSLAHTVRLYTVITCLETWHQSITVSYNNTIIVTNSFLFQIIMKLYKTRDDSLASVLWTAAIILALLPQHINSASIRKAGSSRNAHRHSKSSRRETPYDTLPLKPSLVMVPLDLIETPNPALDPDVDNLDEMHLLDVLGEDYDKNKKYISLRRPAELDSKPDGTLEYQFTKEQTPQGETPDEIAALSAKTVQLSEGVELRIKFSRKTKRKIQKFLWSYSYCPVRYKWKQLSVRFWPRWIKEGQCENKRSCSIPAGMKCQPSKMQNITLLRYYCPVTGSCEWIKIQYPILAQCSCGCQQFSNSDYRT